MGWFFIDVVGAAVTDVIVGVLASLWCTGLSDLGWGRVTSWKRDALKRSMPGLRKEEMLKALRAMRTSTLAL